MHVKTDYLFLQHQRTGSKKAGKRSTTKKGSSKKAGTGRASKKPMSLTNGDDLSQKLQQTIEKHKEVFL